MKNTEIHASRVGKQIYRYLNEDRSTRANTRDLINLLAKTLPKTVVFGGMIRDISLWPARKFNSDIDLVSMANRKTILSVIRRYNPKLNKFGGFRFAVGSQLFDIWSYQDTWAIREGLVKAAAFEDLCATTFFNMDAACQPLKSRRIISSVNYFESMRSRILDINLEANPAPDKVAVRAIRMSIERDLKVSPRLQSFVLKNANNTLWKTDLTGSFLRLMAKHCENHAGLSFSFRPQPDLF